MSRELMSVGFLFDESFDNVLLLRKTRPEWQAGRLNGVGGYCDDKNDTSFAKTMAREFMEETGIDIPKDKWVRVGSMYAFGKSDWMVAVFCAVQPFEVLVNALTNTAHMDEKAEIIPVHTLPKRTDVIGNVRWLVPMAIDKLTNPDIFRRVEISY